MFYMVKITTAERTLTVGETVGVGAGMCGDGRDCLLSFALNLKLL